VTLVTDGTLAQDSLQPNAQGARCPLFQWSSL